MRIPVHVVDAFSNRAFGSPHGWGPGAGGDLGSPAAVCLLEAWLPDDLLQAIAAEHNLSETAFLVPCEGGWALRWFTPATEVDLCGHATLASAEVVLRALTPGATQVRFSTRSGWLAVAREGDRLAMDLPAWPPAPAPAPAGLVAALGRAPEAVVAARDVVAVYASAAEVAALTPDMARLAAVEAFGVCVTAPGEGGVDFVSRYFAPREGIPEDPVTGSAHCTLAPYWAARLGKPALVARQLSRRGGTLWVEDRGDRVRVAGHATPYMQGVITLTP